VGVSDKMATFWRKNVTDEQIRKVEMAFKETEKTPQVMNVSFGYRNTYLVVCTISRMLFIKYYNNAVF
jgi:hypothetical protein